MVWSLDSLVGCAGNRHDDELEWLSPKIGALNLPYLECVATDGAKCVRPMCEVGWASDGLALASCSTAYPSFCCCFGHD